MIQQAVARIFNRIWDHTFSECSFGFRPKRSAHDAIGKYREYVQSGLRYVIDIDLAKWKTIKRFKQRVREITARRRGRSLSQVIGELNQFMRGWWNY